MKIGIIGFGRFGRVLTKHLAIDNDVQVFEKNKTKETDSEIKKLGANPASLEKVCQNQILIPSVPISEFENLLINIKNLLKENTMVIDVCSVKEHPVKLMKQILPNNQILATHPMFGPDSTKEGLNNKKIVLCKINTKEYNYNKIKQYLRNKQLTIIETTPEEHDKQMAHTQVLTHFIGRALLDLKTKPHKIDTEGYQRLRKILGVVENDTWQLFEDLNKYNRFAKDIRNKFIQSIQNVEEKLK